jgi:hypothetical protein
LTHNITTLSTKYTKNQAKLNRRDVLQNEKKFEVRIRSAFLKKNPPSLIRDPSPTKRDEKTCMKKINRKTESLDMRRIERRTIPIRTQVNAKGILYH